MSKPARNLRLLLYLHGVLFLYSIGGIHAKIAATSPFLSPAFIFNAAMLCLVSAVFAFSWQQLLKVMPLNTAYASKAITIVWGFIWGRALFSERITLPMIVGAFLILAGLLLIVSADTQSRETKRVPGAAAPAGETGGKAARP